MMNDKNNKFHCIFIVILTAIVVKYLITVSI